MYLHILLGRKLISDRKTSLVTSLWFCMWFLFLFLFFSILKVYLIREMYHNDSKKTNLVVRIAVSQLYLCVLNSGEHPISCEFSNFPSYRV